MKGMKHVKTFESFISDSMSEAAKYNPKSFDQVKPGNTAFVYGDDNAWQVVDTAMGKDFDKKLKKYDQSGAADELKNDSDWDTMELIAVKHNSEVAVYTYGEDGAWVNK
jgi:hypothetical protein